MDGMLLLRPNQGPAENVTKNTTGPHMFRHFIRIKIQFSSRVRLGVIVVRLKRMLHWVLPKHQFVLALLLQQTTYHTKLQREIGLSNAHLLTLLLVSHNYQNHVWCGGRHTCSCCKSSLSLPLGLPFTRVHWTQSRLTVCRLFALFFSPKHILCPAYRWIN